MPSRTMSLGVLLFVFGLLMFGFKPAETGWDFYFDMQYHVPIVTIPMIGYWILGALALVLSLFFIIVAFNKKWSENIATFVTEKIHLPLFVIYYGMYTVSFINAVGKVISLSPPVWIGTLSFSFGFALFLSIPVVYFKEMPKLKNRKQHKPPMIDGEQKTRFLHYLTERTKDIWRNREISSFKMLVGGICPWCGGSNVTARTGFERRNCDVCQVTFNELCPVCKDIAKSLGFSRKFSQYGCDRCGTIFDKEYNVITEADTVRRTMWFTAYTLRAQWFMSWLTWMLLIIGTIAIIVTILVTR